MRRKKGFYSISVVAKMFSVHQQTIRMYEKEGLIEPKRSSGNTRLFSEEDVDRLEEIIHLTHKMGVNLAGVEMILKLQKRIKKMQDDMNKTFEDMKGQLEEQTEEFKDDTKRNVYRLAEIKKEKILKADGVKNQKLVSPSVVDVAASDPIESISEDKILDDWEIEYEDENK